MGYGFEGLVHFPVEFYFLDKDEAGAGSTEFIVFSGKKGFTEPEYVYYLSRTDMVRNPAIQSMSGTSGRQRVDTSVFRDIEISIPPILEQLKISTILKDLDSKIELNRKMNQTLESIAQTLFKHWFIDFEFPDENGQPYKSSGGEMVFSNELGKEIPREWLYGNILDIADLLSGGTPKTKVQEYWDGGIPWVSAKDASNSNGTFILQTERTISQRGLENSNANLLPKNTTIITARGTVGKCCILPMEMSINQSNYGLKAKNGFGDFFIFFCVKLLVNIMKSRSYGTVFDTITTSTFRDVKLLIPPLSVVRSFEYLANTFMGKLLQNIGQIKILSDIRDSLLPKLISGKIRVPLEDTDV